MFSTLQIDVIDVFFAHRLQFLNSFSEHFQLETFDCSSYIAADNFNPQDLQYPLVINVDFNQIHFKFSIHFIKTFLTIALHR